MTKEEMALADAEYASLPGVPPDGWSFMAGTPTKEEVAARLAAWTDMTFYRLTEVPDPGVWLEVWKHPPAKQAAFNPPYTFVGGDQ